MQLGHRDTRLPQVLIDLRGALQVDDQAEAGIAESGDVICADLFDEEGFSCLDGSPSNCEGGCSAQLVDGAFGDDLPLPDHTHASAHQLNLAQQVTRDQDGAFALAKLDDE